MGRRKRKQQTYKRVKRVPKIFTCPNCGEKTDVFKSGGGEIMAQQMGVPFLGRIPIDPQIVRACDSGRPYVQHYNLSQAALAFKKAMVPLLERD